MALALSLAGCVGMLGGEPSAAPEAPEPFRQTLSAGWEGDSFIAENYTAADGLVANLINRLPQRARILCATFVNRDNFDESSGFGRLSAAQFASRLSQAGFGVLEFRLRTEMGVRVREGEFALSRKTAQYMSENYDAHAILVGSYTVDKDVVFVSGQVVRLDTGVVLAAYDYAVPNRGVVARLLYGQTKTVDFAGYLRGRNGMEQAMGPDTGMLDTNTMALFPERVPGPMPVTEFDLTPPTEQGGPIRLFPPTRLQ